MKKLSGLPCVCAMLFAGIASAQVKDMPGGPRVNQLNLPEGVSQIARDVVWLHWLMLIICLVIFVAVAGAMFAATRLHMLPLALFMPLAALDQRDKTRRHLCPHVPQQQARAAHPQGMGQKPRHGA